MNIFPNNDEMNALDFSIINATYQVHAYLVEHMKPTPLQSHYKFNTFSIFIIYKKINKHKTNKF